jgi:hypothetical protein
VTDVPELRDIWAAACEAVQATDTQRALKLFHTAIMLHTEVPSATTECAVACHLWLQSVQIRIAALQIAL